MFGWIKKLAFRFSHRRPEYVSYAEFLREWDMEHDVCQGAYEELCRDCHNAPRWRGELCKECDREYAEAFAPELLEEGWRQGETDWELSNQGDSFTNTSTLDIPETHNV